ncbi:MAG TPA: hypothetical protein VGJ20_39920 [Xanthobacteraceae bacterium]
MTEKFKTEVRMVPQFGPLEGKAADKPRDRYETGLAQALPGMGEGRGSESLSPQGSPEKQDFRRGECR